MVLGVDGESNSRMASSFRCSGETAESSPSGDAPKVRFRGIMVKRTGVGRLDWHFGEEIIPSVQIHVNEIIRMNVFPVLGSVQQR